MNNDKYTLPRLICGSMQLESEKFPPGKGGIWHWFESGQSVGSKKARISLVERHTFSRCVAFSLDMKSNRLKDRFPFFPEDEKDLINVAQTFETQGELAPLSDIAAICDIIVLTHKEDTLRAFVIEVKDTSSQNTKANRQVENGVLFCEWLHRLLNRHCGIPEKLEIVRITRLTKRERKKSKGKSASANPTPVPEVKTLQYGSDVRTIRLQDAYACCKDSKCLEIKGIPTTKANR